MHAPDARPRPHATPSIGVHHPTNQTVQTLPLPAGPGDAALVFDGCLAVSLNDGRVRVLTPFDGRELGSVSVASQGLSALANDRGKLWAANGDTLVAIHDLELKRQPGLRSSGIRIGTRR